MLPPGVIRTVKDSNEGGADFLQVPEFGYLPSLRRCCFPSRGKGRNQRRRRDRCIGCELPSLEPPRLSRSEPHPLSRGRKARAEPTTTRTVIPARRLHEPCVSKAESASIDGAREPVR